MGTEAFLNKLNLDQLRRARDLAIQMITAKEAEQKLVVWCVENNTSRITWFSDADYLKAAEYLLEEARANARSPQNIRMKDKELHLVPVLVPESEYKSWF